MGKRGRPRLEVGEVGEIGEVGVRPEVVPMVPGIVSGGVCTARERLVVSLFEGGLGYRGIAQSLGLTSVTGLRGVVCRARKKLAASSRTYRLSVERLDEEVVPMAVERLAGMVQAGVPEAVYRTLEGRGVLHGRWGAGVGGGVGGTPTLQIAFTQVGGGVGVAAVGGIVGAPRMIGAGGTAVVPDVVGDVVVETVPRGTVEGGA